MHRGVMNGKRRESYFGRGESRVVIEDEQCCGA